MSKSVKHSNAVKTNTIKHSLISFRNSAVLRPSAQSVTLCAQRTPREDMLTLLVNNILNKKEYNNILKYAVWVQYHSGCRISELLQLYSQTINKDHMITIIASKGSENRVINIPKCGYMDDVISVATKRIGDIYNRYFMYRLYKKAGIENIYNNNINSSVTHALRHEYAQRVSKTTEDSKTISKSLGHKNEKNIKYYVEENKK